MQPDADRLRRLVISIDVSPATLSRLQALGIGFDQQYSEAGSMHMEVILGMCGSTISTWRTDQQRLPVGFPIRDWRIQLTESLTMNGVCTSATCQQERSRMRQALHDLSLLAKKLRATMSNLSESFEELRLIVVSLSTLPSSMLTPTSRTVFDESPAPSGGCGTVPPDRTNWDSSREQYGR